MSVKGILHFLLCSMGLKRIYKPESVPTMLPVNGGYLLLLFNGNFKYDGEYIPY